MKRKEFSADKALVQIYFSLNLAVASHSKGRSTIESFLKRYKYFRYYAEFLVFTKDKNQAKTEEVFLNIIHYVDNEGDICKKYRPLYMYKTIFPFMVFGLDMTQENQMTPWYNSKQLLEILPTRKNIITNLLKEL